MVINEELIHATLATPVRASSSLVREILTKAEELQGLEPAEVATLMAVTEEELQEELFATANRVKEQIYGKRVVLFAPLYISNWCTNECLYCAFRVSNRALPRRLLTAAEIAAEVELLVNQGHKRLLLVAGEAYPATGFQYILDAITTVYGVKTKRGEIRRLNVNIAPLSVEEFKRLKERGIGTYQLFQETYHHATYSAVHQYGKKADYQWRLTALARAMEAGIDDVGVGVLLGLYDWRFEILALLQHIEYLSHHFGVGAHTISVPRLEPALGSELAAQPPAPVSDVEFAKIVAILRLAVPYTGIIMSTRETPELRTKSLALGVSQISAGSSTTPGGYREEQSKAEGGQFSLGDHRSLEAIVHQLVTLAYIPSFCTACYRRGRTGQAFMALAKPGKIKTLCTPNALLTLVEYLEDYASASTKVAGDKLIAAALTVLPLKQRWATQKLLTQVTSGQRDLYF